MDGIAFVAKRGHHMAGTHCGLCAMDGISVRVCIFHIKSTSDSISIGSDLKQKHGKWIHRISDQQAILVSQPDELKLLRRCINASKNGEMMICIFNRNMKNMLVTLRIQIEMKPTTNAQTERRRAYERNVWERTSHEHVCRRKLPSVIFACTRILNGIL